MNLTFKFEEFIKAGNDAELRAQCVECKSCDFCNRFLGYVIFKCISFYIFAKVVLGNQRWA